MCGRMFPQESDEVEKYVGGLPDMIQGNVMSARPKIMQEAIALANDFMDLKVRDCAERQVKNKRKFDNNNQAQQQLPKRQNVVQAYNVGSGEKKEYARTLPLCSILTTARRKLMLLRINLQLLVIVTAVETIVKIKTVNDDVRLQALIDGKKVVITEASIRHDLKLNDAKGTSCLPNVVIFKEWARMGFEKPSEKLTFYKAFFSPQWKFFIHTIIQCISAKTTSWNEFSSTMASAIICLANNQKFNFLKHILDNLKKNLEAGVPFYMFPRFIQVFTNHQISDMSHHKGMYVNPSLTKNVFANMKRVGIRFFRAVTPLFVTMMVQAVEEVGNLPTAIQETPIPDVPSSSQHQRKHKPRRKEWKENKVSPIELHIDDHVPTTSNDPLSIAKIAKLESRVEKLEEENMSLTKELKSFNTKVESLAIQETTVDKEKSSKQGRKIVDIDADAEVNLENVYNLDVAHEETVLSITAGGELNAVNEELVSVAPTNITTTQPSKATKITVDITTTHNAKWIVFHDMEESTTRIDSLKVHVKDKGKAKLVKEPEIQKLRKAQIAVDEEVARRIEAEYIAGMKENINWNEVVKQVQSRQLDPVRKYQALKRKSVLVAQDRKNTMIYLKNMIGFKMDFFKGISYEEIRPLFEEEYNKVQTLFKEGLEMDVERIKGPRNRTRKEKVEKDQIAKKQKGNELKQDNIKKQKLEEQQEAEELKRI
nr:hypothetical protein [Tanacetum cinerariifolium]